MARRSGRTTPQLAAGLAMELRWRRRQHGLGKRRGRGRRDRRRNKRRERLGRGGDRIAAERAGNGAVASGARTSSMARARGIGANNTAAGNTAGRPPPMARWRLAMAIPPSDGRGRTRQRQHGQRRGRFGLRRAATASSTNDVALGSNTSAAGGNSVAIGGSSKAASARPRRRTARLRRDRRLHERLERRRQRERGGGRGHRHRLVGLWQFRLCAGRGRQCDAEFRDRARSRQFRGGDRLDRARRGSERDAECRDRPGSRLFRDGNRLDRAGRRIFRDGNGSTAVGWRERIGGRLFFRSR